MRTISGKLRFDGRAQHVEIDPGAQTGGDVLFLRGSSGNTIAVPLTDVDEVVEMLQTAKATYEALRRWEQPE